MCHGPRALNSRTLSSANSRGESPRSRCRQVGYFRGLHGSEDSVPCVPTRPFVCVCPTFFSLREHRPRQIRGHPDGLALSTSLKTPSHSEAQEVRASACMWGMRSGPVRETISQNPSGRRTKHEAVTCPFSSHRGVEGALPARAECWGRQLGRLPTVRGTRHPPRGVTGVHFCVHPSQRTPGGGGRFSHPGTLSD